MGAEARILRNAAHYTSVPTQYCSMNWPGDDLPQSWKILSTFVRGFHGHQPRAQHT